MKNILGTALLASTVVAGALAMAPSAASAAIVCSGGACWHTHAAFDYPTSAHVIVHDDDWRWGPEDHYVWREHAGRGYWHGDAWEDF